MSVLVARGAGVRHRRRWLFRDLDVTVEPAEIVAVVGPPGSGRTTVLLALAGRFRLTGGRVDVTGGAALGYVPDVEDPEPVFSVAEHVRERLALLGRSRSEAAAVPLLGLDPERRGRELTPYEKQVLGLILARLSGPAVIALDGFDAGLDTAERESLLSLLAEIAASGTAILLTAREIDDSRVHTVIRLGAEGRPTVPEQSAAETTAIEPAAVEPETGREPAAEGEPAAEVKADPEATADPEAEAEPEAEVEPEARAEPEAEAEAGTNRSAGSQEEKNGERQ